MTRKIFKELKARLGDAPVWAMIIVSIVFALVASFFPLFKDNQKISYVCSGMLLMLALITRLLLGTNDVINHLVDKMESPVVDDILRPLSAYRNDIKNCIDGAEEIWLLSKTGRGWWRSYLKALHEDGRDIKYRLMFVAPDSPAVDMIKISAIQVWDDPNTYLLKESMEHFLNMLKSNIKNGNIKVMNYFPPWTILIINPKKRNSVLFLQLGQFYDERGESDVIQIHFGKSDKYEKYKQQFCCLWDDERITRPW